MFTPRPAHYSAATREVRPEKELKSIYDVSSRLCISMDYFDDLVSVPCGIVGVYTDNTELVSIWSSGVLLEVAGG